MARTIQAIRLALLVLVVCTGLFCCTKRVEQPPWRKIAVTTSTLAEIVKELTGGRIETVQIIPPGSCPGHFDSSPDILVTLRKTEVCLAHDFQSYLGEMLAKKTGISVFYVAMPHGLSTPSSFRIALEETASILKRLYPELVSIIDEKLAEALKRNEELENEIKGISEDLKGIRVFASLHQKDFCEWVGIEVVKTFSRSESVTPEEIENMVSEGKRENINCIVANLQEGVQYPRMLAEKLRAPFVVLSNFPGAYEEEASFEALVMGNVGRLKDCLTR